MPYRFSKLGLFQSTQPSQLLMSLRLPALPSCPALMGPTVACPLRSLLLRAHVWRIPLLQDASQGCSLRAALGVGFGGQRGRVTTSSGMCTQSTVLVLIVYLFISMARTILVLNVKSVAAQRLT